MIKALEIKGIGNIKELSVELGKVNVFIGENLAGQSFIYDKINQIAALKQIERYGLSTKACINMNLEPISLENLECIKDKLEDWFYPIFKDFRQVGRYCEDHLDYYYEYQSEYDDEWYSDRAINEVIKSLHSVLNPELGSLVLEGQNFGECLNPRLARKLLSEMIEISEKNKKQLIIFTQQPNVLDALDLNNDSHRLFAVGFWRDCSCRVIRITSPIPLPGQEPVSMSEAWLRGYIGGLPKGF